MTKICLTQCIHWMIPVAALLFLGCAASSPGRSEETGTVTVGDARFTIITPQCVRMEYSKAGMFVDDPSIFAVNRSARCAGYVVKTENGATTIDTGSVRLVYKPDGKPFSPANLQAFIKDGPKTTEWKPGAKNTANLGGTTTTLDGWDGPRELGEGLISRDGWFLLDDSRGSLFTSDWARSRPEDAGSDWYLFGYGSDYKSALRSLTTIGGSIPMPRKYAFGVWYSRYWPYSSDDYRQIVKEYSEHDFPLDVMVMDMDWHKDGWTGWSWNRKLLPDAEDLLKWFHEQDLSVTLNLHPAQGVKPHEDMYDAFMRDMGKDPAAQETITYDVGDKKYMNTLFKHTHEPLEKEGVDFWWLDWQQYPFTKSIPDLSNLAWLNHLYYQHSSVDGKRGMSFSRWAGWGDHRHPIHFSGDASTSWKMLAFEVPFTSTSGNVGCFFWSHDIGGHQRGRNEESYTRWCQFGALTAALRSHSTRDATMDRRPWTYPKWAEDSMRRSSHLRSELFPYIYSSAWQSCRDSVPLNRPMYIEYPRDEKSYRNPQQYFFGDNLLVSPIVTPGTGPNRVSQQVVWFPKGTWYNYFTGERCVGDTETLVSADINEFPLYVRGGAPLPMQPYAPRMATTPLKTLVVRCYPGQDGKTGSYTLYEDDGLTTAYAKGQSATTKLSYTRRGYSITVTVAPTVGTYQGQLKERGYAIDLPCTAKATSVTVDGKPATAEYDEAAHTNRIHVAPRSIGKGCKVVVEADTVDFDMLHARAVARRAGITPMGSVKDMLASSPDSDAVLAAAGVGIVTKNEAVYLYPAQERTYLYVPTDLLDSKSVKWTLKEQDGDQARVVASADGTITGHATPAPKLVSKYPPLGPRSRYVVQAEIRIAGRTVTVSSQPAAWDIRSSQDNIARSARVTTSSAQDRSPGQGAIDGIVEGYPSGREYEWASNQEGAGAWIRLEWDKEQAIDRIWLFDRPNTDDHITSGELSFSDGSAVKVGELPDDASEGLDVRFPSKKVTWAKFTVTGAGAKTQNAGISEIVVFRSSSIAGNQ